MSNFYELLDTGDQKRLERFGDRVLIRPSKFSVWRPRAPRSLWESAHASYDHRSGWKYRGQRFSEWESRGEEFALKLRLQESGQVGFFPEHLSYLPHVSTALKKRGSSTPTVLNLFAYTGMASVVALQQEAEVTHVDLSKKVLEWAKENFELNKLDAPRFIREDALSFMEREMRRGNRYNVIIADPPSFSRVSGKEEWALEEVLTRLIRLISELIEPEGGEIFLTSHHFESGGHVMANLLLDSLREKKMEDLTTIETSELVLRESNSKRVLPAGFLVHGVLERRP